MADAQTHTQENGQVTAVRAQNGAKEKSHQQKRGPSIHQIYALPAPIRTFPLPTFYPHNPLSWFAVAHAWLRQILSPPAAEPAIIHQGFWDKATGSVHMTDDKSVRALWEQGFYGKGSLSRSEPNWLKREQVRRGQREAHVSEILTLQRRQERAQAKWERARLEQEAIRQTRLKEAQLAAAAAAESTLTTLLPSCSSRAVDAAPVGPLELLRLPNSEADRLARWTTDGSKSAVVEPRVAVQVDAMPSSSKASAASAPETQTRWSETAAPDSAQDARCSSRDEAGQQPGLANVPCGDASETMCLKQQKTVRFSPRVESADAAETSETTRLQHGPDALEEEIVNMEHLQLMPEEAFFLTFGLGALCVKEGVSGRGLTNKEMLTLFRQYSYFPPRIEADEGELGPDDGFLLHYAVYHHFRSLGWVPRAGVKFGVDWLLYTRGPVFDHAEFGLIIIPSYSDAWWKARGTRGPQKTWYWLHGVVRVLSHVMKSLVLVYVDVPPGPKFEAALETGYAEALKLYRVREVMVKRWSSNRNR